jgi:hypothetical protein
MKGINFKPDMIQAIIEGRKTQTRRVIKPQPILEERTIVTGRDGYLEPINLWIWVRGNYWNKTFGQADWHKNEKAPAYMAKYAPYKIGETVYIKEAWATEERMDSIMPSLLGQAGDVPLWYKLDYSPNTRAVGDKLDYVSRGRWRSPMMMPEWAARYFILIKDVRAERLQEITPGDALREGIVIEKHRYCIVYRTGNNDEGFASPLEAFRHLWNSINKEKWESNPFVWVYTFELKK